MLTQLAWSLESSCPDASSSSRMVRSGQLPSHTPSQSASSSASFTPRSTPRDDAEGIRSIEPPCSLSPSSVPHAAIQRMSHLGSPSNAGHQPWRWGSPRRLCDANTHPTQSPAAGTCVRHLSTHGTVPGSTATQPPTEGHGPDATSPSEPQPAAEADREERGGATEESPMVQHLKTLIKASVVSGERVALPVDRCASERRASSLYLSPACYPDCP